MLNRLKRGLTILKLTRRHFRASRVSEDTCYRIFGVRSAIRGPHVLSMVLEIVGDDAYGLRSIDPASISTVVDIGANVGVFSIASRALFPAAAILAFEPVKATREILASNLEGLNITVRGEGVGGEHALMRVESDGLSPTMFYLRPLVSPCGSTATETAQQITLSEIVDEIGRRIDLLKIDCEGCEYGIFQSAAMRYVRHLRAELHIANEDNPEDGMRFLTDAGFRILKWNPFPDGKGIVWAENRSGLAS